MTKHPVTEPMRQILVQALRDKRVTQLDIANAVGKQEPWASKLLNGKLRTISEDDLHDLENFLGIQFFSVEGVAGDRSSLASAIAEMVDNDPAFAKIASALHDAMLEARGAFTPRYVPTEEMASLGRDIIAIVAANKEKPGKVAREVLRLLA